MDKRFFFPLFLTAVIVILLSALIVPLAWIVCGILGILCIVSFFFRRFRLLLCVMTVLSLALTISVSVQTRFYTETIYGATVTGRVSAVYRRTNEQIVLLKDAVIEKKGKTFDCMDVEVCLEEASVLRAGYVVRVDGTAYGNFARANNPGEYSARFSALANKCSHIVRNGTRTEVLSYEVRPYSVFDALRRQIREKIYSVGEEDAVHAVLYAMITGDRGPVSAQTYEVFTDTGTAHLLAVSGLHVSILLGMILFVLRRLPVRPIFYLAPLSALVVFYCFLTGLSSSVLRAAIMAILFLGASSFGTRYDPLNALSFAGLMILLVNPFRLFDCAFQLSFSAFFTMAAYEFSRRFKALSLSFAATLGSLPVSLIAFRRLTPLSVFTNLLFVPIASTALLLLWLGLVLSAVAPSLTFVLAVPYRMIYLLLYLSSVAQSWVPPILTAPVSEWLLVPALGSLLFFSRFVHVRRSLKQAVASVLIVALLACMIGSAVYEQNTVTLCALADDTRTPAVHVKCGADVMVHSPVENEFIYKRYLANNVSQVDALFVLTQEEADQVPTIWADGGVGCLYFLPDLDVPDHLPVPSRILNDPVLIGRATFSPVNGGLLVSYRDQSVFIEGNGKMHFPVTAAIGSAGNLCDILISHNEDDPVAREVYPTDCYGCVYLILGKHTEVRPFHEVTVYESY